MPTSRTVDIKVFFELYNMEPGPKGRSFQTKLMLHGGKSDSRGYSYTFLPPSASTSEGGYLGWGRRNAAVSHRS